MARTSSKTIRCTVFPEDTIEVSFGPGGTLVEIVDRCGKKPQNLSILLSPKNVKRLRKRLKPGTKKVTDVEL